MRTNSSFKDHGIAPHLALVAVQFMFGTWPILGKIVLRSISSTGLVAFRIGGGALAFMLLQRKLFQLRELPKRDFLWLALCSLLGVVVNQLLFVKGLSLTTVINATLLGTTIPVFTLAVSITLGYDRLSLRRALGIALAAAGVIYLVDPMRADFSAQTRLGNILIVANSLSYGAYIAISKDLFDRYGALNVITWMFALGAVIVVPLGLFQSPGTNLEPAGTAVALAVFYIVLVPTVGCYYLNAWALTRVTPSTVATYIYLQPLIAAALSRAILGETVGFRVVVASVLIFAGVGVVTRRARSRAAKDVAEHPDALAH